MSQIRHCRICNKTHKYKIKGLLSFPKHFVDKTIHKYYQSLMKKIDQHQIQQVSLSENYICYILENDICKHCWLFMHQGFLCQKCQIYNNNTNKESKICCLCNTQYCINCQNQLDLFSQNKLCENCQLNKDEQFGIPCFLFSFLIIMIPCFAFILIVKLMLKRIQKFNYSTIQQNLIIIAFFIAFPLLYILSNLGLLILWIGKISKLTLEQMQKSQKVKMIFILIQLYFWPKYDQIFNIKKTICVFYFGRDEEKVLNVLLLTKLKLCSPCLQNDY
ncbi:unnamed protein product [Paramecium sonneborni]|uniref:Transmembrane protein n=1 Tax=Paramecium sonneborni TaxID=65129 RepID=A0A8S1QWF0_9CILI|nr:unnamed protein product [Paramecium sonneborni]